MAEQTAEALFDALDAQGPSETLPAHLARRSATEEREGLTDALGPTPRLIDVVLATCTAVDTDHHRATFDCGPRGSVDAYYWPNAPAVGDQLPVRFASQGLEPWTRTNPATPRWLYWLQAARTARGGSDTVPLRRTRWPLEDTPEVETVADLPSHGGALISFLGFDGQGTAYVQATSASLTSNVLISVPEWGMGTPIVHELPAEVVGSVSRILHVAALASAPDQAGVLVGYEPTLEITANPGGGPLTLTTYPELHYYRSDDAGATWTALFHFAFLTGEWIEDPLQPGHFTPRTYNDRVPLGATFAWRAADAAEASTLGVANAGDLALTVRVGNYHHSRTDQFTITTATANHTNQGGSESEDFTALAPHLHNEHVIIAAGLPAAATWRLLRVDVFALPLAYARSVTGPTGAWSGQAPPVPAGDPSFDAANERLFPVAQDRDYTHLIGYVQNQDTAAFDGTVYTTDGGATWHATTPGQSAVAAELSDYVQVIDPLTLAFGGVSNMVGGGWIGSGPPE